MSIGMVNIGELANCDSGLSFVDTISAYKQRDRRTDTSKMLCERRNIKTRAGRAVAGKPREAV